MLVFAMLTAFLITALICAALVGYILHLYRQNALLLGENEALKAQKLSAEHLEKIAQQHLKAACTESITKASEHLFKQSQTFLETHGHATDHKLKHHNDVMTEMLKPFKDALSHMHEKMNHLEKARAGAYEGLTAQIKSLSGVQNNLYKQTGQLLQALQTPNVRGRWGEFQLRRLVEWSGMLPFCDFLDQSTFEGEKGLLKPDMIIKMPLGRHIVVDAKTPLSSYLQTHENNTADGGPPKPLIKESAHHLKKHINDLSRRDYLRYVEKTPDFVLLFLPTEALLIKALEEDPSLLDYSMQKAVLLTTPMTFIALLKMIALGWHQEALGDNAQKISALGKTMSDAFGKFTAYVQGMGRNLKNTTKAYNDLLCNVEETLMPCADELGKLTTTAPSPTKKLSKIRIKNDTLKVQKEKESTRAQQHTETTTGTEGP